MLVARLLTHILERKVSIQSDKEASLSVIENQEFVAMRAAEKLWLVPTTTED
jgi:hypothetical protein